MPGPRSLLVGGVGMSRDLVCPGVCLGGGMSGGWVFPLPANDNKWWPPHIQSASGWYASYWNAFLFTP